MQNLSEKEFYSALEKHGSTLLFRKIPSDTVTPVLASLKISAQKEFSQSHFLFESAEKGNNKGRFSVIGFMSDLAWKCEGQKSFINSDFSKNPQNFIEEKGSPIANLRQLIKKSQIDWTHVSQDFAMPSIASGIFGYMSYDMVRLMEKIPDNNLPDELKIPDSIFMRPQIIILFDNFFDCAFICAPVFTNNSHDEQNLFSKAQQKISLVEEILKQPLGSHELAEGGSKQTGAAAALNFSSNCSEIEYCSMVEKAKKYIADGDIFQVLPSQRFTADFNQKNISEFSFYRALRSVNPSPFLFFLKFPEFALAGSSPEIMVSLKNKKVTIRPLAGTRKRGKNSVEDKKIAAELLKDEKEVAEHLMLIDLGRHDVGRVSKEGSVFVTEQMNIENYSHVMHISSNVEGIIRDELDAVDALISGFPAGTVSGAPKIRAMEIIEEIEKVRRSFYAGTVGYFASNGDMETCITLRSALIKDNKIYLQSGAGIVFDSNPKSEYQECINKAQALMKAYEKISDFEC